MSTADRRNLIGLSAVWLLAVLIVNPSGNFPIIDDWSYAYAVRALVTEHRWQLNEWTSVPLGTQVLWGALFTLPAGFSFDALRISTLVLAWTAGIGTYYMLRMAGAAPGPSLAAALTLLFSPVFFALAFTFMTDVPFVAFSVWGIVFTLRAIERNRRADWAAAVASLTAAVLIRHIGVTLAVASGIAIVASGVRHRYQMAAVVALFPAAALLAYNRFVDHLGAPALYHMRDQELASMLMHPFALLRLVQIRAFQSYVYLGLFAVSVAWLARSPRPARPASGAVFGLAALVAIPLAALLIGRRRLPLIGYVLYDAGLNPIFVARGDLWPRAPVVVWIAMTVVAVVSAGVIAAQILRQTRPGWSGADGRRRAVIVLWVTGMLAYLLPVSPLSNFFDRYLLLPLVLLFGLLASLDLWRRDSPRRLTLAFATIALVAIFDVAAVHDFLAYNRARWTAVDDLLAAGVPADRIEGGGEVNGWIAYQPALARRPRWWDMSVAAPDALLSLGPVDGYQVKTAYPFSRWIGSGPGFVNVLTPTGR